MGSKKNLEEKAKSLERIMVRMKEGDKAFFTKGLPIESLYYLQGEMGGIIITKGDLTFFLDVQKEVAYVFETDKKKLLSVKRLKASDLKILEEQIGQI